MKKIIDLVGRILGMFAFDIECAHYDRSHDGGVKLLYGFGVVLGYVLAPSKAVTWFAMPAGNMAQARKIADEQHSAIMRKWVRGSDCSDLLQERERQFSCRWPDKQLISTIQRELDERAGLLPLQHAA